MAQSAHILRHNALISSLRFPLRAPPLQVFTQANGVIRCASSATARVVDLATVESRLVSKNVVASSSKTVSAVTKTMAVAPPSPPIFKPTHTPVLFDEVLSSLTVSSPAAGKPRVIVDGTVGLGGHAEGLLIADPDVTLLCLDRDESAVTRAAERLHRFGDRATVRVGSFADIEKHLEAAGLPDKVDGILLDLGLGSHQLDDASRGLSYLRDGPLDMRYQRERGILSAAKILGQSSKQELATIFSRFGDEPQANLLADAVVQWRGEGAAFRPISTTLELRFVLENALRTGKSDSSKLQTWPRTRHRVAALEKLCKTKPEYPNELRRCFQALRIVVNEELHQLDAFLNKVPKHLAVNGTAAVIAFQPAEDERVVQAFQAATADLSGAAAGSSFAVSGPVRPSYKEMRANPRSRSAHMRLLHNSALAEKLVGASATRGFHTTTVSRSPFTQKDFEAIVAANTAKVAARPPHPASVLPLTNQSVGTSRGTDSVIRPGLAAALIDSISGMENKVATLVTQQQMFSGRASALNPGGGFVRRRKAAESGSLREALEKLGMAAGGETVAPGAAGGKRVNFQPETLKQVARTLSLGQSPAAKSAIMATVNLRLKEQTERHRRDAITKLADRIRSTAGRSSDTGAQLNRVQALAIARHMLQQHEAGGLRTAARPSKDAADARAAKRVATAHDLEDAPFVMWKPSGSSDTSTAVTQLKEAFNETNRPAFIQVMRNARNKQRDMWAAQSASDRDKSEKAALTEWAKNEEELDNALEQELKAEGAAVEDLTLLREYHAERQAARQAAVASGDTKLMQLSKFGQLVPSDVASLQDPVLGADARATLTRDDARRTFVAWMSEQDHREKAFLNSATNAGLSLDDMRDIKSRIDQNRKLRSSCLRRGDVYIRWSALLSRGYDTLVLNEPSEDAEDATLQNIEED